jgi:predicted nucleotidyltransferase
MVESPHYKELLQALNDYEVEYLIVGGYAVMKYTEPRYTKDLDVWVNNSSQNSVRVFHALAKFGAWPKRVKSAFFGVPVHFISLDDLIANKRAAGRSTDLEHLQHNGSRVL